MIDALNTMGIDPSLTSTGVSVGGQTVSIRPDSTGPERLIDIRDQIIYTIHHHQINCVAIEHYSYASRNSQAHSIGELGGVLRVALYEAKIATIEIPPTCRAKFATGKGNAGKAEVVSAISAKTGIVWNGSDGSDRCDAWILEEMIRCKMGISLHQWPKASTDGLEKVDWSPLDKLIKGAIK
jgi:Holliday junction resolvasome RuvABC endonuclease subunit